MPVNYADGTMFSSIVLYPIVAANAAISAHAGWFTIGLVAASLPVGFAVIATGRKLLYSILDPCMRALPDERHRWLQWIIGGPLLLAYILLPLAFTASGLCGVWLGTTWLVQHVL
jgi:hypothetical protein